MTLPVNCNKRNYPICYKIKRYSGCKSPKLNQLFRRGVGGDISHNDIADLPRCISMIVLRIGLRRSHIEPFQVGLKLINVKYPFFEESNLILWSHDKYFSHMINPLVHIHSNANIVLNLSFKLASVYLKEKLS